MSIGNNKSEGNKGYNYPYQSNVLKGLQRTLDQLQQLIANTVPIGDLATEATLSNVDTKVTAVNRTPNYLRVTNSSAVNVPTYSLSVANIGLADGTFLGTLLRPGEVLNFDAGSLNNVYPSGVFTYNATGTEFIIIYNA
jgi:hypothetical protein